MLRRLAVFPILVGTVFAATGWLYLVRPAVPGPRVGEALPLDELARSSSVPLLWFAGIWILAATALGLYARSARLERLTSAITFGVGTGLLGYLQTGVSIAVVRQIPLRDALDAASRMQVVYLPAALVALSVAALAPAGASGRRRRSPVIVASVVAAGAALNLLHTILPGDDAALLHSLTPDAVGPLARAAGALAGVALLIAARGLARRRRRAWQVAMVVAGTSAALHVLNGLNHGTLASAVVLVLLVARRHDFDRPGDSSTRHVIAARAGVSAVAIALYAVVALWVNQMAADQPLTVHFAAREILRGLFGLNVGGSAHLEGSFGDWFPLSLLLLGIGATVWVVAGWLAPWRYRTIQLDHERVLARALVHAWGVDTLAPFVLRADKSYFFDADQTAFLAYRVVGGVAIVSGDPIGPRNRLEELIASFVEHAHARDWRVAILGASEGFLPLYTAQGLHALYHGDEAVVESASFALEGRAIRKVRQSARRLELAGYRARVLRPSELDERARAELEDVARSWRGDAPERGFVMALDALFGLGDEDAVFVVGFAPGGEAAGFLHFALSPASAALSLSSMPRLRTTPNGFNEWLVVETISWARKHGYERVSLNFAPFAALLAPEADLTGLQEVQRRALMTLKGHFQLDNLLTFNRKFFPQWERRFVVYESRRDLPRVGIAALAAEAYLPFQGERR